MPETGPGPFKIDQLLRQEDELLHLWQDVALPDLVSRGPLFTGRPKAFIETTRRMELWLGSMQLFREPCHHQAAAAGARALFELALDMKSLASDPDGSLLEKFEAFPEVEHFRVSEKLVAFYRKSTGATPLPDLPDRQAYVSDIARRDRIYATTRKLWGKDPGKDPIRGWPKHWTDQGSERRAREHGIAFEEHHVLTYARLSLYLHSGAAGAATDPLTEAALLGQSHAVAAQAFLSALAVLAPQLALKPLGEALEAWAKRWHESKP